MPTIRKTACVSSTAFLLLNITFSPNPATAQGGAASLDTSTTSSTTYATTSTNELLPVPAGESASSSSETTPEEIHSVAPNPVLESTVADQPLTTLEQTRIINLAANISNRLDTAAARLQNIHRRMVTRAELLKASGYDTTAAETALAESKIALDLITNRLAPIDSLVYTATTATTPKTAWVAVSQEYSEIANELRTAKVTLITALTTLKSATPRAPKPPTATTTTTTNS